MSSLFPFGAVNSHSSHKSSKLSKTVILLVKSLVSWLLLVYFNETAFGGIPKFAKNQIRVARYLSENQL